MDHWIEFSRGEAEPAFGPGRLRSHLQVAEKRQLTTCRGVNVKIMRTLNAIEIVQKGGITEEINYGSKDKRNKNP